MAMKTDVDSCLKEIADWYVSNRHEMTQSQLDTILKKHCQNEAEMAKFTNFLMSEPGQVRFKTLIKEGPDVEQEIRRICSAGVRGHQIDTQRAELLLRRYPQLYARISAEERKKAHDEMNPLASRPSELRQFVKVDELVRLVPGPKGSKYRREDWPEGVWLGDVAVEGTVTEFHAALPTVRVRGEYIEGIKAWAVVKWDNGASTAIDPEDEGKRWERITPVSKLEQPEPCDVISPEYFDVLGLLDSVPLSSFEMEPAVKERKIDDILKKLREGVDSITESSAFREFLLTMSKFHQYSIGNQILIMIQRRNATHVAGFNTWKDLGRYVKGGEKGIAILAPCLPPKGAVEEIWRAGGQEWVLRPGRGWSIYKKNAGLSLVQSFPSKGEAEKWLRDKGAYRVAVETIEALAPLYFKVVYVFDVNQTEGKPLPEVKVVALSGAANEELFGKVLGLLQSQGVKVSFESMPQQDPSIKGQFTPPKEIWVRPEESRAQQLKTTIHETAHYYTEAVFFIPHADAETIAESAAFVVGAHFGFDTGTYSFPYVAIWAKEKKVLEKNLLSIRKVVTRIIDELEKVPA